MKFSLEMASEQVTLFLRASFSAVTGFHKFQAVLEAAPEVRAAPASLTSPLGFQVLVEPSQRLRPGVIRGSLDITATRVVVESMARAIINLDAVGGASGL